MASLAKAWPAAASALMLLAAFPPFNLGLLVFVALVPWLVSLRSASGWGAARSGFLFGFLYMLGQLLWLQPLTAKWTGSQALSIVPLMLGPLVVAPFFALAGWLIFVSWRKGWPWMIPIVWSGVEVLRSYCPGLAFPWGLLGTPLYPYPAVIQLAWFGGIAMVSGWVMLGNVWIAKLQAGDGFLPSRAIMFAFLFLAMVSTTRYSTPATGTTTVVTVGQLGIDLAFGNTEQNQRELGEIVDRFQDAAIVQGSKLLVLPEGLIRGDADLPPPVPFKVRPSVPVLFGGQRGRDERFQSAYGYDGEWKAVDKTRLVVFGEYVPGRDYLPFLEAFRLPDGDLKAGDRALPIEVGGMRIGPLLCFEALFPDVARKQVANGVQLLAVMALDDWYFGTQAPEQLMAASVFRAVESGLPVVRSAPLGHSIAVKANGEIVAKAPLGESIPLRVEVPIPARPDNFAGSSVYEVAAALACLLMCGIAWQERRPGKPHETDDHSLRGHRRRGRTGRDAGSS